MTDYVVRMDCEVRNEAGGTRVLCAGRTVLFAHLPAEVMRRAMNDAMEVVVSYFAANAANSGLAITPRQIDEGAFRVSAYWISTYASWRSFYPDQRKRPLTVTAEELRNPATFDQCYDYCKQVFGTEFRRYVAALLGLSEMEFARIEKRRQEHWNR